MPGSLRRALKYHRHASSLLSTSQAKVVVRTAIKQSSNARVRLTRNTMPCSGTLALLVLPLLRLKLLWSTSRRPHIDSSLTSDKAHRQLRGCQGMICVRLGARVLAVIVVVVVAPPAFFTVFDDGLGLQKELQLPPSTLQTPITGTNCTAWRVNLNFLVCAVRPSPPKNSKNL
jgi:hypothetical protein